MQSNSFVTSSGCLVDCSMHSDCNTMLHQGNTDVLSESLDITGDLLARFGNAMSGYHSQLRVALLPHLEDSRPVVRKRAIQCMGKLQTWALEPFQYGHQATTKHALSSNTSMQNCLATLPVLSVLHFCMGEQHCLCGCESFHIYMPDRCPFKQQGNEAL